jgi:hypothetical protein
LIADTLPKARSNRRSFYHLELVGDAPDAWEQFSDHHTFQLFWARLDDLPELVAPQQAWVDFVRSELGYRF